MINMNESRDRIKKYVSKLLTHHVKTDDPGISDNLILFVEFLKTIYKNEKIFVFDIPFVENIEKFIQEEASRILKATVAERFQDFFSYGEGRKVIEGAIKDAFLKSKGRK
jgi:hypothetical protein